MSGHFSAENIGPRARRATRRPNVTSDQPSQFAFDEESLGEIEAILAHYPDGRQASGV